MLPWAGQLCFSLGECTAPAQALEEFLTILKEVEEEVEEAEREEEGKAAPCSALLVTRRRQQVGAQLEKGPRRQQGST